MENTLPCRTDRGPYRCVSCLSVYLDVLDNVHQIWVSCQEPDAQTCLVIVESHKQRKEGLSCFISRTHIYPWTLLDRAHLGARLTQTAFQDIAPLCTGMMILGKPLLLGTRDSVVWVSGSMEYREWNRWSPGLEGEWEWLSWICLWAENGPGHFGGCGRLEMGRWCHNCIIVIHVDPEMGLARRMLGEVKNTSARQTTQSEPLRWACLVVLLQLGLHTDTLSIRPSWESNTQGTFILDFQDAEYKLLLLKAHSV